MHEELKPAVLINAAYIENSFVEFDEAQIVGFRVRQEVAHGLEQEVLRKEFVPKLFFEQIVKSLCGKMVLLSSANFDVVFSLKLVLVNRKVKSFWVESRKR